MHVVSIRHKGLRHLYKDDNAKGYLAGFWSLTVTGNWRMIFQYEEASNTASILDLIDYH